MNMNVMVWNLILTSQMQQCAKIIYYEQAEFSSGIHGWFHIRKSTDINDPIKGLKKRIT